MVIADLSDSPIQFKNAEPISFLPPGPSREDLVEVRTLTFRNLTSIPIQFVEFEFVELLQVGRRVMGLNQRIEPFETVQISLRLPRRLLRLILVVGGNKYCINTPGSSKSSFIKSLDGGEHEMIAMYFDVGFIAIYETPKLSSWMKSVNDSWLLSALSIPGTHELPSYSRHPFSQHYQFTSITDQLENGIRFLNISILGDPDRATHILSRVESRVFRLTDSYFADLCEELYNFLQREPAETVLLSLSCHTSSATGSLRQELLHLKNRFIDNHQSRWWTEPRIPTLGEARGRIVLMRRYILDEQLETCWSGKGYGINTDTWLVNATYREQGATYYQPDNLDARTTLSWKETVDSVCRHLDLAVDRNPDITKHDTAYRLYVSFLGSTGYFDSGLWTAKIGAKANQAVIEYLSTRHGKDRKDSGEPKIRSTRTGLVVMDWADWELVICIIGMNAKLEL